ncbi:MAG: FadR family transcriptional regulator [Desulfobulbaceae bacterium]|nr:FadR family transcriptional regulator [Desulfobulbaceae bacterium]
MGLSANQDGNVQDVVSRAAEIVALIKKKITFQEYLPGDVLPKEETLALKFSVSRACIRECLGILKAQGYLESRRGKNGGTFVKNILESNEIDNLYGDLVLMGQMQIRDLLNARLLIEPEAARAAALKAQPDDIELLNDCVQQCRDAKSEDDRIDNHIKFHNAIGQISNNPFYAISIRSFMKFTKLFMKAVGEHSPHIHDSKDHERILYAIKSKNPDLAYEKMYVHNSKTKENMMVLERMFKDSRELGR